MSKAPVCATRRERLLWPSVWRHERPHATLGLSCRRQAWRTVAGAAAAFAMPRRRLPGCDAPTHTAKPSLAARINAALVHEKKSAQLAPVAVLVISAGCSLRPG